jgi:hypothetical protein
MFEGCAHPIAIMACGVFEDAITQDGINEDALPKSPTEGASIRARISIWRDDALSCSLWVSSWPAQVVRFSRKWQKLIHTAASIFFSDGRADLTG